MAAAKRLPLVDPEKVLASQFPEEDSSYTESDVALYALGVGAAGIDPTDPLELPYVYHPQGQHLIKVLPTFTVVLYRKVFGSFSEIPGLHFDPKLLLHGEQYIEIYKPLPTNARVSTSKRVCGLHDKGKAALVELELIHRDLDTQHILCIQRITSFLRGAGGFSSNPEKPFSYSSRTSSQYVTAGFDDKRHQLPADIEFEDHIQPNQALVYRLSGDMNPLHSDPRFAGDAGFERPILHGLCTLGFAVRAMIRCCCDGDPTAVLSVNCRFLHHVFPGECLRTSMRKESSNLIFFKCMVPERKVVVLSGVVSVQTRSSL